MARCSLLELNESELESFLLKIFVAQSPLKSSIQPGNPKQ